MKAAIGTSKEVLVLILILFVCSFFFDLKTPFLFGLMSMHIICMLIDKFVCCVDCVTEEGQ